MKGDFLIRQSFTIMHFAIYVNRRDLEFLVEPDSTETAPAAPFDIIIILHKCVRNTSKYIRFHKIILRNYEIHKIH